MKLPRTNTKASVHNQNDISNYNNKNQPFKEPQEIKEMSERDSQSWA